MSKPRNDRSSSWTPRFCGSHIATVSDVAVAADRDDPVHLRHRLADPLDHVGRDLLVLERDRLQVHLLGQRLDQLIVAEQAERRWPPGRAGRRAAAPGLSTTCSSCSSVRNPRSTRIWPMRRIAICPSSPLGPSSTSGHTGGPAPLHCRPAKAVGPIFFLPRRTYRSVALRPRASRPSSSSNMPRSALAMRLASSSGICDLTERRPAW